MATNPELEAAIEKDPDDEDAYFVYGDWLQGEGDPRGELIAMQAAQQRDPNDKRVAQRVTELLARNDRELLGELGEHMDVVWHLGFVRHVTLAPDKDPAKPIAALAALLAHPSGRFVQSIAFAQPKGIDFRKVVELLVEGKRPATLAELRIAGNFDIEADAPELLRVFPRLRRSLDVEWKRILHLLSEQRTQAVHYDADKLPKLLAKPDAEARGVHNEHVLLGLRLEIEKKNPLGIVAAMKRSFIPESLDRFAVALGDQFVAAGAPTNMRWGFQAIGKLGDAQAVGWIASRLGEWSHQRAVQGAELLGEIRTNAAIWELYAMIVDPALNQARRDAAGGVLDGVARARALSVDQLLDRSIPPVAPETRKRSGRTSAKREQAFDDRSRVRDAAIRRLQAHMIDGRRISQHDFVHYFVRHPVMAPLVRRVLWATFDGVDVETTFRTDGEGKALDAGGDEIDLDGATVGVVHPAEIADRRAVLKEWKEVFDDDEVEELFPQLERPVHELQDKDRTFAITRFKLRRVGWDQLRTFEHALDWAPDREDNDGGPITVGWSKYFKRDGVVASANVEGAAAISEIVVTRNGKRVSFEKIHPVTASEILWAVERATTREKAAPAAEAVEIEKGMRVMIVRGANQLRVGVVFWIGDGDRGPRCGIRADNGDTLWANVADVKPTTASAVDEAPETTDDAEAPDAAEELLRAVDQPLAKGTLTKGMKVRWTNRGDEGTGVVFWIGKNKFGDGMRAGVKDDETGETVWADADDCEPIEA